MVRLKGGCSLVLGISNTGIGPTRFTGLAVKNFIDAAKSHCGDFDSAVGAVSRDPDNAGGGYFSSFCLIHTEQ